MTTLTTKEPGLGGGEGAAYLNETNERDPRSTSLTVELQTALGEIAGRPAESKRHTVVEPRRAAFDPVQARQPTDSTGQR